MKINKSMLVGLPIALSASYANAALIDYDFTVLPTEEKVSVFSRTTDGVTVNITATDRRERHDFKVYVDANPTPGGLGVSTGRRDSHDLDGGGWVDERLNITFDHEVELVGLRFTDGDHDFSFRHDDMDFYVDDVKKLNDFDIEDHDNLGRVKFSPSWFGTQFGVVADWCDDTFYLSGVTIKVADVPEPGSLALLGLGLAGFAASRRKKA